MLVCLWPEKPRISPRGGAMRIPWLLVLLWVAFREVAAKTPRQKVRTGRERKRCRGGVVLPRKVPTYPPA